MNEYQRGKLEEPPEELVSWYECNDVTTKLPAEILQAAQDGNIEKIQDYLNKALDVNALCEGESLLSRACAEGQEEIVKLLLQCPPIHTNSLYEEKTPLMRAAQNGHTECVEAILNATVSCRVDLNHCRKAVSDVLKKRPQLCQRSALFILSWAGYNRYWDVVQLLLLEDYLFTREDLYPVAMRAVDQDNWDIVCGILNKDFYGRIGILNEVFALYVKKRLWEKVDNLMKMMSGELMIDLPFVEAALAGNLNEVQRLFTANQYGSQTLNGALLVVAAGGMSEPVAKYFMAIRDTYTKRTFSDALYLAALGHYSSLLTGLLSNSEASYGINDLYLARKLLSDRSRYKLSESFLISYVTKFINVKVKELMP